MSFPEPFAYPRTPFNRRHGPQGYLDPQNYKPWLRDEFQFRCVYCLVRETWYPEGDSGFGVDHVLPRSKYRELNWEYDNLVYACCRCNAAKQDLDGILDPSKVSLAENLIVDSNGMIHGLTDQGNELIFVCQLGRMRLVEFRRGIFEILELIQANRDSVKCNAFLRRYFGFPSNLPQLRLLKPPGANSRPTGIAESWFEKRLRNQLPDAY